jgi:beta-phosphoglucomutase
MIKAFIFDMDGVIFDTEHKRFKDLKKILKRHGRVLDDSRFTEILGRKSETFVKEVFPGCSKEQCAEIAQERRELQYHGIKMGRLIKGTPELLRYLKLEGYKVGLATGSKKFIVEKLLDMYLMRKYFDVLITGEDYRSSKPDPECYRVATRKLGVAPKEAVVVEDAVSGIKAAKKVGCKVFGLKTYFTGKEMDIADKAFDTPKDILKYVKNTMNLNA